MTALAEKLINNPAIGAEIEFRSKDESNEWLTQWPNDYKTLASIFVNFQIDMQLYVHIPPESYTLASRSIEASPAYFQNLLSKDFYDGIFIVAEHVHGDAVYGGRRTKEEQFELYYFDAWSGGHTEWKNLLHWVLSHIEMPDNDPFGTQICVEIEKLKQTSRS